MDLVLPTTGDHERFMRMALRQAAAAREEDEVPAGCVIVDVDPDRNSAAGTLLGSAHNQVERLRDPTAHAEMLAITQAASALGDWRLGGTAMYVTKEPCAMCAGAIVLARIPLVVFGATDRRRGGAISVFNILNDRRLNHRCRVIGGVLEEECAALLKAFFTDRRDQTRCSGSG
jgi:tRNA(adenine34) deaminase